MNPCPSHEQLSQYLAGELAADADQALGAHLETCASCQRRLEVLTDVPTARPRTGLLATGERPGTEPPGSAATPLSPNPSGSFPSFSSSPSRAKLSDDQLHRLRHLLPSGSSTDAVRESPAEPPGQTEWPNIPGYEILRVLGHGGMAVVYEARQLSLNRRVALKILRAGDLATPEQLVRFRTEGEIVAHLRHPHIVQIYEVGTHNKQPYFALELMEGGSLAQAFAGRPSAARAAAELMETLARAMDYAHRQGIVHRDLNPANILLQRNHETHEKETAKSGGDRSPGSPSSVAVTQPLGWSYSATGWFTPKITDFGLAKHVDQDARLTQTGFVMGTPSYMAPEQVRGQNDRVGPLADVYALGAILYELLTGRPPFQAPTTLEVMNQVSDVDCVPPSRLFPKVPRDLEVICLKCLQKEPARRYASALALAEDLCCFQQGKPIRARPVSRLERMRKWARRRPAVAALALAVLGLVLLVTVSAPIVAFREARLRNDAEAQRDKANDAQQEALLERDKSRQLSAGLALDRGVALAEAGQADRGLLWMLEALKTAPESAEPFKRMVRWNLGAWLGQVHKPVRFIDLGTPCSWCALSRDGRSLAAGGGGVFPGDSLRPVGLWDTVSGRKLSTLPNAYSPFAFRPDGKALIAYNEDSARMKAIDLATEAELWKTPPLDGRFPFRIDFTSDGSTILALRSDDAGNAWLYRLNVLTGKVSEETIRGRGSIALAPGGKLAAVGRTEKGEAYIDLVELPSGRRAASLRVGATALQQLLFSQDGKSLYVCAREHDMSRGDSFFGRMWAVDTQRAASPPMAQTGIGVYTPSADRLVTATENLLVVREATGRVRGSGFPTPSGPVGILQSGPDGRTIAAMTTVSTTTLWEISAEAEPIPDKQATLTTNSPRTRMWQDVFMAGLRADGQIAVSLSLDAAGREQVRLSDPATGRPIGAPAPHHPGWKVRVFAFSPDGRCFATGSNPSIAKGELRLWDTNTGRLLLPPIPLTNYVSAVAFHPDGNLVATGDYSGLVRTWDLSTGRETELPLSQGEIVLALSFSPDGNMLAVGLAGDHTGKPGTRLWDARTRQPIGDLLPTTDGISRIVFRPDGRALLAGTYRSTRLWDTIQGRALTEPIIDEETGGFRHDGRAFLTVGGDGTVKIRDATTGEVLGRFPTSSSPATCAAFRGDDGLVAAGFEDGAVRLYDPATNQPVGPPRFLRHTLARVAFTSDGRSVAAIDGLGESRTWPVSEPLDGNMDDLALRIEARTGLRMETGLALSRLNPAAWQERLEQLGRLDPSAAGPDRNPAWHAPLLREAEQNGNAFAAIWHLDRLIAARPDDWLLYARRGRARSLSDQLDKAADDFQKAQRLSSRDRVLDFQTHCVLDCTKAERWAACLWYLDRLIAARPKDWSLHLDRAAVYGKLGREADRQAELTRVFELGADEGVVMPRAEELGRAGRWSEAARLLADCGRRGPLSQQLAQAWAIACLQAKDDAGYRKACAAALAWQGSEPTVIWNALAAASVFALGPKGLDDYQVPLGWMEHRLSAVPAPIPLGRHLCSNALGGLLLRAGRLDEAIIRINEGIAAAKDMELPTDWTYLALAHARKGKLAEARQMLESLRELRPDSSSTFWDLQELALLRGEAETLVRSGKEKAKK